MSCAIMFPSHDTLKHSSCSDQPGNSSAFTRRPYCSYDRVSDGVQHGSPFDLRVQNATPTESVPCSVPLPGCSTVVTPDTPCRVSQTENNKHVHDSSRENERSTPTDVKYLSANCIVMTHYTGDVSSMVDEHFTRALSSSKDKTESSKGMKKNFPPSFYQPQTYTRPSFNFPNPFTSSFGSHGTSELYEAYHGGLHALQAQGVDAWSYNSLAAQTYGHRSMGYDMYGSSVSNPHAYQYPTISGLQQPFSRFPNQITKPETWASRYYDSFQTPSDFTGSLETPYPSAHYPSHAGLESAMNDCQKELYWV